MSGHSKWATTKHQKAVKDARRGKEFARLIKNIEVAARTGGGDPAGNPTLYDAIQKAKKTSVPNDNIERARKRGGGVAEISLDGALDIAEARAADLLVQGSLPDDQVQLESWLVQDRLLACQNCLGGGVPRDIVVQRRVGCR